MTGIPGANNALRVRCEFVLGSDANGCMVVLLGDDSNHTRKIIKTSNDTTLTELMSIIYPSQCYHSVVAFDIESDDSIGQLPVPGYLEINTGIYYCSPSTVGDRYPGKSVK